MPNRLLSIHDTKYLERQRYGQSLTERQQRMETKTNHEKLTYWVSRQYTFHSRL